MNFNTHSKSLEGRHAFLGASQSSWVNYDIDKLRTVWHNVKAKEYGTELHAFAKKAIELGIKLPRVNKTLNMYVNDAIGYHMVPEQMLYYSDNCFGTADAIQFTRNVLRIYDLKTGIMPATMRQLEVYTALFCLEYHIDPHKINTDLRIYQNDAIESEEPNPNDIQELMDKIVYFDREIEIMKQGGDYVDSNRLGIQ